MPTKNFSKRRGCYGRSKFRVFIVLEQLGPKYGRDGYLSTRELVILSGLPYRSLTRLLINWVRYEYISRRVCSVWSRGDFEYKLEKHGEAWLKCAGERLYNKDMFFNALKEWVNFILPHKDMLLRMPFNSMVEYLVILGQYKGHLKGEIPSGRLDKPFMSSYSHFLPT